MPYILRPQGTIQVSHRGLKIRYGLQVVLVVSCQNTLDKQLPKSFPGLFRHVSQKIVLFLGKKAQRFGYAIEL